MSENVEQVDFGRDQREAARTLARLLNLVAERDADMLRDPKKYFQAAGDEIIRLRLLIRTAQEAAQLPLDLGPWSGEQPAFQPLKTLTVERGGYDRLKAMYEIIMGETLP